MAVLLVGACYLAGIVSFAALILLLVGKVEAFRRQAKAGSALREALHSRFEQRLRNPDWKFYETYLQRPAPAALHKLYGEPYLSAQALHFRDMYFFVSPLDEEALTEDWVARGMVAFARCEADPVYLKPGDDQSDSVFITYHDGGNTEELAPSIEAFVDQIRLATPDDRAP